LASSLSSLRPPITVIHLDLSAHLSIAQPYYRYIPTRNFPPLTYQHGLRCGLLQATKWKQKGEPPLGLRCPCKGYHPCPRVYRVYHQCQYRLSPKKQKMNAQKISTTRVVHFKSTLVGATQRSSSKETMSPVALVGMLTPWPPDSSSHTTDLLAA
jgi:hypothetical protein